MSYRPVHARRRVCGLLARTYACERLEGRCLLSAVMWTGEGDRVNWTDPRNWTSNPALPGPTDDVTISGSLHTIHLASGDQSIRSIMLGAPLSLDGGSLAVATTANAVSTGVILNGGTVKGGTWSASFVASPAGSTLDGVVLRGGLDLSIQNDAQVTVLNGLSMNGSIVIGDAAGSTYGRLMFGTVGSAAGILQGNANVIFGESPNNALVNRSNLSGAGGVLSLDVNMVRGMNGSISSLFPNGQIVSQSVLVPGARGTFNVTGTFINRGSLFAGTGSINVTGLMGNAGDIQLTAGQGPEFSSLTLGGSYTIGQPLTVLPSFRLTLNGSWSSSSTITVSGGDLRLGGIFSLLTHQVRQSPTISGPQGSVEITGTLNGDLTLDAATGSWTLVTGGTIAGGTVTTTQGAQLTAGGTLDGVTLDGTLVGRFFTVLDGMVLNNGTILVGQDNNTGVTTGAMTFGTSSSPAGSLTGNGTVVMSGDQNAIIVNKSTLPGAGGMLLIGSGITIDGPGGRVIGPLHNQGQIVSDGSGGDISLGTVVNDGTISAKNGARLSASASSGVVSLTNNGTVSATTGGILSLSGVVQNFGTMRFDSAGVLSGAAALQVFSGRVTFADNTAPTVNTASDLNLFDSGVVDLGNNVLQIASHGQDATIRSYLRSAYDAGRWDGPGITSSDADATHGIALRDSFYDAVPGLGPNTIDLRLARVGDLNLDGKVDFADLLALAQHYGQAGDNWDQGDLNYDSSVNFSDLLILAQNYGRADTTANSEIMGLRRRAPGRG